MMVVFGYPLSTGPVSRIYKMCGRPPSLNVALGLLCAPITLIGGALPDPIREPIGTILREYVDWWEK